MTAQTTERAVQEYECGWCRMTADLCLAMRDDCCPDCTHYDEPPADSDVDEVAVERAMAGDLTVTLNRQDAAEAHRRLHDAALSIREIAERLGTTERTVDRWNQGHTRPITRRGRTMTDADTIDTLLATAKRHPVKRVQSAAKRAEQAVQKVRDALAADADKAAVRARVAKLEAELRAARAELKGGGSVSQIDSKSIRAWADANGQDCPPRGRIPKAVIDAYENRAAS